MIQIYYLTISVAQKSGHGLVGSYAQAVSLQSKIKVPIRAATISEAQGLLPSSFRLLAEFSSFWW